MMDGNAQMAPYEEIGIWNMIFSFLKMHKKEFLLFFGSTIFFIFSKPTVVYLFGNEITGVGIQLEEEKLDVKEGF